MHGHGAIATMTMNTAILNKRGKVKRSRLGGRPRNPKAVRDASGKSRGEAAEDVMAVALAQPHRAGIEERSRHDALAGHPLGWLRLTNKISRAEYAAGQAYSEIVRRYRIAIGCPDPDMQPTPGKGLDISREEARRRKKAYDEAFESMRTRDAKEVARVAVHQRPPVDMVALQQGLSTLALHLGFTKAREYANGETTS
jgi:hypothetical protein